MDRKFVLLALFLSVWGFETSNDSADCNKCLHKQMVWCPTPDYQSGYCCKPGENCPRSDFCSSDMQNGSQKKFLCPNKQSCVHERELYPPSSGKQVVYDQLHSEFTNGEICSYKLSIPTKADLNDVMYVRIEYIHNAELSLVKGKDIS